MNKTIPDLATADELGEIFNADHMKLEGLRAVNNVANRASKRCKLTRQEWIEDVCIAADVPSPAPMESWIEKAKQVHRAIRAHVNQAAGVDRTTSTADAARMTDAELRRRKGNAAGTGWCR